VSDTDELALALRRGEERALVGLYDRYGGAVYRLALRITRDRATAEEISLDSFHQVWQQAGRYDAGQGSLTSWLFTIARSRALDRVRAASAAKRRPIVEPAPVVSEGPEMAADLEQRRVLVRTAMAQLPEAQRAALELAYYEGLSHSEIAARLDQPLGTVKTRIRQAMLVLRQSLEPVLSAQP
jgi:RNA polymerase sigma-70 factor (ECF subfamily)